MSIWRDMAMDGGLHIDAGVSLDEAAAWVEQQQREEWEKYLESQRDPYDDCADLPAHNNQDADE